MKKAIYENNYDIRNDMERYVIGICNARVKGMIGIVALVVFMIMSFICPLVLEFASSDANSLKKNYKRQVNASAMMNWNISVNDYNANNFNLANVTTAEADILIMDENEVNKEARKIVAVAWGKCFILTGILSLVGAGVVAFQKYNLLKYRTAALNGEYELVPITIAGREKIVRESGTKFIFEYKTDGKAIEKINVSKNIYEALGYSGKAYLIKWDMGYGMNDEFDVYVS